MEEQNPITVAIGIVGLAALAKRCGVSYQAVRKWEKQGRMPRTEWTGETHYSEAIAEATDGQVTRDSLLAWRMRAAA